jgi:2-methylisocitrate lyase-like PEP mutase family enzyme
MSTPSASHADLAAAFAELHRGDTPLLMANAWDIGTAKSLAFLGYQALATTSAGHAAVVGRHDGGITRDEAIAHAAELTAATGLPVNGDFENGFADEPDTAAETYRLAAAAGVVAASIEDWNRDAKQMYDIELATARVAAAAEAAHGGTVRMVLTARCEHHIRGVDDLAATISRLQAYQEAGADVLYAPGIVTADQIRAVVSSVDRPVNVLALPGVPPVAELAELGVARVSVGSGFSLVAYGALANAAQELLEHGTYGWWEQAGAARAFRSAFDS